MARVVCHALPAFGIPALYLHDLTGTPDAERLLQLTPPIHPASSHVLSRLQAWVPEVAKLFVPVKMKKTSVPFRLVTQSPTWEPHSISDFVAISYCWHSDEWQLAPTLKVDDPTTVPNLPFSPLMLGALMQCLPATGTAIWIDQVSIEQTDAMEKKHAIEQMDTIYRNARRTIILLEDVRMSEEANRALLALVPTEASTPEAGKCDPTLPRPSNHTVVDLTGFDDFSPKYLDRLARIKPESWVSLVEPFFDARWFNRAWCKQEYLLSASRLFLVPGNDKTFFLLNWDFFSNLASASEDLAPGVLWTELDSHDEYLSFTGEHSHRLPDEMLVASPFESFCQVRGSNCSIPSDMIAISMNIVGLPFGFVGTPGLATVEYILAALALAMGDASVLGLGSSHLPARDAQLRYSAWHTQPGRPYFVDDWDKYRWSSAASRTMQDISSYPAITSIYADSITLGLFWLKDHPRKLPWLCTHQAFLCLQMLEEAAVPFPSHLSSALRNLEPLDLTNERYVDALHNCSAGSRDPIDREVACIALAAMVGSQWTAVAALRMQPLHEVPPDVDFVTRAWSAASSLFTMTDLNAYPNADEMQRLVCHYLQFALHIDRYMVCMHGWCATTIRLGSREVDHALLFLPDKIAAALNEAPGDIRLTVPVALSTSGAIAVQRVWLLRPAGDTGKMSCFAKGYLFGYGRIYGEEPFVKYVHDAVVVGPPSSTEDTDEYSNLHAMDLIPAEEKGKTAQRTRTL